MLSIIINILIKFNKNLQDNRLRENFGDFGDFMLNETSSTLECQ